MRLLAVATNEIWQYPAMNRVTNEMPNTLEIENASRAATHIIAIQN